MPPKIFFFICTQTLFIQSIFGRCIGAYDAYDGFALGSSCGYGPASLAASHGPGLTVTSSSPIVPVGVSVISENAYEGPLGAGGAVPFLGTIALEGGLPSAGAGVIAYSCGIGTVAITAEDLAVYTSVASPLGYGCADITKPFGYGYGRSGLLGYGASCGGTYY